MLNIISIVGVLDQNFSSFAYSIRGPIFDAVNFTVTYLGHWLVLFVGVIIFAVYTAKRGYFYMARFLFSAFVSSALLSLIIKMIVDRERPSADLALYIEHLPSFPSAHAALALAFWGSFIIFVNQLEISSQKRLGFSVLFGLVILLVGFSRIYLGVHFLSDVIAGYILSAIVLAVLHRRYKKYFKK
jgi:membrane-associated phospholipid phosphatase